MITANLATYPARRETAIRTARAIAQQVDRLNIVLNDYAEPISELSELKNIQQIIPNHDLKDAGKFLPDIGQSEFVILIDDDLTYADDYVSQTLRHLRHLGDDFVVGYHASLYYHHPPLKLSRSAIRLWRRFSPGKIAQNRHVLHFSHGLEEPIVVDQLGTGTVAMRAAQYPGFEFMRSSQRFVDVRFANWCFQNNWRQVALPRSRLWIGETPQTESIYEEFTKANDRAVAAEIRSFAFKAPGLGKSLSVTVR